MFKKLIKALFDRKSPVERFINSKNPQNAAEVEYWLRHYGQNTYGGFYGR